MCNKALENKRSRMAILFWTIALVVIMALARGYQAQAAGGLELFTTYSSINIKAGESLTFNLYAVNNMQAESELTLSVESMPEGFYGFFKSGSYEVNRVHLSQGSESSVASFQVSIPKDTAEGQYEILLKGTTEEGLEDTLSIIFNVTELEAGESNFSVEYPEQEGVTGTSFTYSTTIANNTLSDQTYNFSYNAPSGWQVTFKSSSDSTQISSIEVASGDSEGITITVTPPEKVEAGDYTIDCSAVSAKENMATQLSVKILGTYDLKMTTTDGKVSLDAYANKESKVTMKLTNSGNIDLENINLTSSAPSGWNVTFEESTIDVLEAGATKEVQATITPGSDALTGDYVTYIKADSDDQTESVEFRITVKTQTGWGVVAILIIAAVIVGLGYVIKKYGRR